MIIEKKRKKKILDERTKEQLEDSLADFAFRIIKSFECAKKIKKT